MPTRRKTDPERGTVAISAAVYGRAIQRAVQSEQTGCWPSSVRAVLLERIKHRFGANCRIEGKYRPLAECAATGSRPIQDAIHFDKSGAWRNAVAGALKSMYNRRGARNGVNGIDSAAAAVTGPAAALDSRSVQETVDVYEVRDG